MKILTKDDNFDLNKLISVKTIDNKHKEKDKENEQSKIIKTKKEIDNYMNDYSDNENDDVLKL